jgi:hypothetical protein
MGGNSSKDNPEMDWQSYQARNQSQQVMSQTYSQNVEAGFANGYGSNKPNPNIGNEVKRSAAVKVDFDIKTGSAKVTAHDSMPHIYVLGFDFSSTVPLEVFISIGVDVRFDKQSNSIGSMTAKRPEDSRSFSFNSGENQRIQPNSVMLDLRKYSFQELSGKTSLVPLVVVLNRKVKVQGFIEQVIYFYKISQQTFVPEVMAKCTPC